MSASFCSDDFCVVSKEPKINVKNLHLSYGESEVLNDVNVQIPACQVTALIGPSGCGKTSFLNVLNRMTDLIPHCQIVGSVEIDGEDILGDQTDVLSLRKKVGMIFQKPNPFPTSIWKNLDAPLRYHGLKKKSQREEIILKVLEDVGLWDEVKDRCHESALRLSGGQQQRLCIARACMLSPEVLVFDEPCSSLDPLSTEKVEALMERLKKRYTLVVVTHNIGQAKRVSDHTSVFWLKEGIGTIIESAPTQSLFATPQQTFTAQYIEGHVG